MQQQLKLSFFFGLYWLLINYFGDSYILGAHKFEFVLST